MNFITGNKIGSKVTVMINGKLYNKDCGTDEAAKQFFSQVLETKNDPTNENIEKLYTHLNANIRLARAGGFEVDIETGEIFLEGHNTPVPQELFDTLEEYEENGFPIESLKNFWVLLMANPDKRVRTDLFKFIQTHDFSLTDKGYMVVYKTVNYMHKVDEDLASFVSETFLKVKKWKKAPKSFNVYEVEKNGNRTFQASNKKPKKVTVIQRLGRLDKMMSDLDKIKEDHRSVYTDKHTNKMKIILGKPVKMERTDCDADPKRDCSYGLHVGATKYVENFRGYGESPVLVCLVNPMHVVAVPEYDHSKMRVSEYFPFAKGTVDTSNNIDIVETAYFENDYVAHEENELAELLRANEEVRETAINAEEDERSFNEYLSILEQRVVSLSE